MKSTQKIILGLVVLVVFFLIVFHPPGMSRTASLLDILPRLSQKPVVITQEDIPNLTNPAVVRIINQVTGDISIPSFTIDWTNLAIYLDVGPPVTSTVDTTLSGSGIIVNPDGYILTNSHVISTAVVKQAYVNSVLASYAVVSALQQAATMSQAQQSAISDNQDQITAFLESAAHYLLERTTGALTSTITVLNPSSTDTDTLDDLVSEGFPGTIISVDNNFLVDGKDVGVIKINQQNLPSIPLGDSGSLSMGQPIYAIGFPGSADVDLAGFLQSTITAGSIDAFKPSAAGDFQLIQTDAKVSEGSSGGPLLDSDGTVIGLTTLGSDPTAQIGDTFAFGIPVSLAESTLSENSVTYNATDTYYNYVLDGIALLENNHCKQAISEFQLAEQTNQYFPPASGLSTYISQCQAIIASGKSIDTRWDEVVAWAKTSGGGIWWIISILALIVVAVLVMIVRRLLKVIKKEEANISRLEGDAGVKNPLPQQQTVMPMVPGPSTPGLVEYIKQARMAGKKDEEIIGELGKMGWNAGDIATGLENAGK